jgi:hypothetical protein
VILANKKRRKQPSHPTEGILQPGHETNIRLGGIATADMEYDVNVNVVYGAASFCWSSLPRYLFYSAHAALAVLSRRILKCVKKRGISTSARTAPGTQIVPQLFAPGIEPTTIDG